MNKKLLVDVRPFEISRQKIDESIDAEFMGILNYSWGYKLEGSEWKDVNTFIYNPALVLGYKYHLPILSKRLFVEAFAGVGYNYDNPEDGDVKLMYLDDEDNPNSGETAGSNGFGPDFNVYIGFTF